MQVFRGQLGCEDRVSIGLVNIRQDQEARDGEYTHSTTYEATHARATTRISENEGRTQEGEPATRVYQVEEHNQAYQDDDIAHAIACNQGPLVAPDITARSYVQEATQFSARRHEGVCQHTQDQPHDNGARAAATNQFDSCQETSRTYREPDRGAPPTNSARNLNDYMSIIMQIRYHLSRAIAVQPSPCMGGSNGEIPRTQLTTSLCRAHHTGDRRKAGQSALGTRNSNIQSHDVAKHDKFDCPFASIEANLMAECQIDALVDVETK